MGGTVGEGVIFQIPVMTIPPPQSCPSGGPCPGILPSSALPSPSAPGPEFQINWTDANACTRFSGLTRRDSGMHRKRQTCAETHLSVQGKQTH